MSYLFTASAQSATSIQITWNLLAVDPGVLPIPPLTITQTDPSGNQKAQTFNNVDLDSNTVFSPLLPNTTYTYDISLTFDDGTTFNPEPGIPCTTPKSGASTSHGGGGGGGVEQFPIPPDPITKLTASWNVPDYTAISVSWELGANTTSTMVTYSPGSGEPSSSPWANGGPGPAHVTQTMPPDSYLIKVVASNGSAHQSESETSSTVSLAAPPGPGAITDLTAVWNDGYTGVIIQWQQGPGSPTTAFQLQRYSGQFSGSASAQETIKIQGSPFTDTPGVVSSSSQYQYRLTASNAVGQASALSNSLNPPTAPPSPANVVAKWGADYTRATVSWDPSDHADDYEVILFRVDIDDVWTQKEDHAAVASTNFTEPLAGQVSIWYIYQIVAQNRFGSNNTLSNSLTVPPPPPPPPPQQGTLPGGHTHPVVSSRAP